MAILEPAVSILEMSSILTKNRKWPAKTLSNVSRSPLKQPDSPWGIEAIKINLLFSRFGYRNKINLSQFFSTELNKCTNPKQHVPFHPFFFKQHVLFRPSHFVPKINA